MGKKTATRKAADNSTKVNQKCKFCGGTKERRGERSDDRQSLALCLKCGCHARSCCTCGSGSSSSAPDLIAKHMAKAMEKASAAGADEERRRLIREEEDRKFHEKQERRRREYAAANNE